MKPIFCLIALLSACTNLYAASVTSPEIKVPPYFQGIHCEPLLENEEGAVEPAVLEELNAIHAEEDKLGVAELHKTKAFLVRRAGRVVKTRLSIVISHGLLNSPAWTEWIAVKAHSLGLNVINARLPSHFEGERQALDHFNYVEAIQQAQKLATLAEKLGDKVVYIGHSTGGAISIFSALNNLSKTAGLILFSPSLQVNPHVSRQSSILSALHISGWLTDAFSRTTPGPMDRYMSTYAGVQVTEMGDELSRTGSVEMTGTQEPYGLLKQRLAGVPILWFDTAVDAVVDIQTNTEVADSLPKTEHYVFPAELNIAHVATSSKSAGDSTPVAQAMDKSTAKWLQFLKSL